MLGIQPIKLVHDGLGRVDFPPLARPHVGPKQPRTEELINWAARMYTYSVIAHIRKVLSGLILLAGAENVPASHVISRHVFEWAAQTCYMSNKLKVCYEQKDWEKAWEILTPAAIGNLWANKFGAQYAPAFGPPMPTAPNPVRIGKAIAEYEAHQEKTYGYKEAKDTYGLLSEYAHPNAVCLQQYHTIAADGTLTIENNVSGSSLPFVNWCLMDLLVFCDTLLGLSKETAVRAEARKALNEILKLAPKARK